MVRTLLATTALATVLATGAFAQDTTAPATTTPPAATDGAMKSGTMANDAMPADGMQAGMNDSAAAGGYLQRLGKDQYLASDIDDETVYAGDAANAEEAGEIQNLVVKADGTVTDVVIDTSFLDDDKTVAVPFDQVTFGTDANNNQRAVLKASRDQIMAAPAFTAPSDTAAVTGANTGVAGTGVNGAAPAANDTAMAPATAPAAGATDTAMAPAVGNGVAPAAGTATGTDVAATVVPGTRKNGYLAGVGNDEYLSEDLIGQTIYSGPGSDAQTIGDVNDLVVASDGKVDAVVVGVGGFLGIGEKDVAVPFDQIAMTRDADGDLHSTLAATRDQLNAAPAFNTDDTVTTAANNAAATAGTAADNAATATGTAVDATATAAGTAAGAAAGTVSDATTTASTGGAQNTAAMTPVTGADLSADKLMGTNVYGPGNQTIGSISDIALTADGKVDAVIVDVGGFLGIGAKPVAVAMDNLQFMKDSSGTLTLTTQFTQDQLKNAPEYNSDTYAQNRGTMRIENAGDMKPAANDGAAMAPATGDAMAPAANGEAKPADTNTAQ